MESDNDDVSDDNNELAHFHRRELNRPLSCVLHDSRLSLKSRVVSRWFQSCGLRCNLSTG